MRYASSLSITTFEYGSIPLKNLEKRLKNLKEATTVIELENTIFKSFLDVIPPPRYTRKRLSDAEPEDDDPIARKNRQFCISDQRYRNLDPELKCIIAHNEYWICKNHFNQTKKQLDGVVDRFDIALREYTLELKDIQKAKSRFDQFMNKRGYNERMKCIAAEKFESFIRDNCRKRDVTYDEIHLQNAVLLNHLRKIKANLRSKETEREMISKPDYDMLELKNKEMLQLLFDKMKTILELKLVQAKQSIPLSVKRNEMKSHMQQLPRLMQSYKRKMEEVEASYVKLDRAYKLIEHESRQKEKMTRLVERYKIPNARDLMASYAMNKALTLELKSQNRQKELAKSEFERHQEIWRKRSLSMRFQDRTHRLSRFAREEIQHIDRSKR